MRFLVLIVMMLFIGKNKCQSLFQYSDTLNKKRRNIVLFTEVVGASSSLVLLNEVWYKNYPKTSFHTFNDNDQWLQMDKVGHSMTSYYLGVTGIELMKWSGLDQRKSAFLGGTLGLIYLSGVEYLDGKSDSWGFSWGDMIANGVGSALAISEELLWNEQRVKLKIGARMTSYALIRPNVLGSTRLERLLKDYNGQTYWLSINIRSMMGFDKDNFPSWLNLALGYSAKDMISGDVNSQYCIDNPIICSQYSRYRQGILSLDIDLTKIRIQNKFVKTVFGSIGWIKVPAPGLIWDRNGVSGKLLYL